MGTLLGGGRKAEKTSIHKIRELVLREVNVEQEYDIIKEIGSGDYGKVMLAEHKQTHTQVALKAVPKATTALRDFLTEFHYSYFLSPHHVILCTYEVAFQTPEFFCFAQEIAPLGDLWQAVERTGGYGLLERDVKLVVQQIVSAVEFLHEKQLVHRDLRAENVLLFTPDYSRVKLTDFGLTRKAGTLVKKRTRSLPTCPPEIWETLHLEGYHVELGSDVWQLAMLIYATTQARFPWDKADITDPRFHEFTQWQKRKTTKAPKEFRRFTPRLLRCFRRLMEIKPSKRYPITEVNKYLKDQWLVARIPRQSVYLPARPGQTLLDVPSISVRRESVSSNMMNAPSPFGQQPVSRSLSCSHLLYAANQIHRPSSSNNLMYLQKTPTGRPSDAPSGSNLLLPS